MIDMVKRGDLGRKSGRGFYDWPLDRENRKS
jgi:3-hydroxyacyl-CoA dehydrogenase